MANKPLPPLDAWQTMEIELRGFPIKPHITVEQEWWRDLTAGNEFSSSRKPFERVDKGPIQGREFALSIDPLRIVWKADWLPNPENPTPLIGRFVEVRDWMTGLMQQWLSGPCPPLKRLGFAAKILLQTSSREESYEKLAAYLPHVQIDPNSQELLYRINRPRASSTGIAGLRINRLATWAGVKILFQMKVRTGDAGFSEPFSDQSIDACQLQLDINTNEDRTEALPHEKLPEIWGELVTCGSELAERGDIP